MSLADAVKNGPRATNAKVAHIEAKIRLEEAKAVKAQQQSAAYRRKATGDGPMAKYRKIQADAFADIADRHRAEANHLKLELAKAKADEAARHAKHVKHTKGSTADEFGTGPTKPGGQARPTGQVAKPAGQGGPAIPKCPVCPHNLLQHNAKGCIKCKCKTQVRTTERTPEPPTKGHPMPSAVSGEAVNIEQTRANLDQLKTQVTDLRGSFEGTSGSLASGGLDKLAGSLAQADDALDSVLTQIQEAETHLANQEAIAEAAQAAGEMHTDTSFYAA